MVSGRLLMIISNVYCTFFFFVSSTVVHRSEEAASDRPHVCCQLGELNPVSRLSLIGIERQKQGVN